MKRKVVLTGDRPTGRLHLGHYVGSLRKRVELQEDHDQFVMIADIQALTDNMDNTEKVHAAVYEVMLDYLAVGIDPEKTVIFLQSGISALAELTVHLLNLVSFERVRRNPTVKTEIAERNLGSNVTAGFVVYPVSQVADIVAFKADVVPVGADQKPMIELTNEIVRKFNALFKHEVFRECEALIPCVGRLPGVDGRAKMGKSLGNAIYLSDSSSVVSKAIKKMFTDPKHLRVEDPGHIEGNVVFTYLDAFDPDINGLNELKESYQRGGVADGMVKARLQDILQAILEPIRRRREDYSNNMDYVRQVLREGTERARSVAYETLAEARKAMGFGSV